MHRIATTNGVDSPATALASEASTMSFPLVLKPRRGSDSIGVRLAGMSRAEQLRTLLNENTYNT